MKTATPEQDVCSSQARNHENDVLHAEVVKQVSGEISFGKYEGGGEGAEGREGVKGDRGTVKEGGEMERRREEKVGGREDAWKCMFLKRTYEVRDR